MLSTQSPYQAGPETDSDFLNRAKMDVKALVFEFDRPSEPTLKVFTNTNTYYLSATVRKPPEISRVVHGQPGEFDSSVSSFRDFDMRVPGQSDADTLSRGDSMEDLSDVTLVAKPVKTYEVTPRLYNINGLWSKLTPEIKRDNKTSIVKLPVTEDRRIRNRQYSYISVEIRTKTHTGIVLLRSFRLTRGHIANGFSCAICDNLYKTGQTLVVLPCGHLFHKSCILLCLSKTSEHCPECGLDITRPGHPVLSDVSISSAGRASKSLSDNDTTLCSL
ncbi:hypothetical protein D915_004856 [Fasciola hepatica]|uniref:RING-type domain-containing protein n=1 Tax=Fasciola hepatica TaxID=6192 RepID=A0A4E0RZ79_FASHE|nr:hypothetical protein D915_004856 [Fasciola hepatica]